MKWPIRSSIFVMVAIALVVAQPMSRVTRAQEAAWELADTVEFSKTGLVSFNFDIQYPSDWMMDSQSGGVTLNEMEADHQIALDGPFATEGYSINFVFHNLNDLQEVGLPSEDPTLENLFRVISEQSGYQGTAIFSELRLFTWPALQVQTIDGMGNHVSVVLSFYGDKGAFTATLAAPSAEKLYAFLPTWNTMLEDIQINSGAVAFGDYSVNLACSGEGSPTVILEPNINSDSVTWDRIQDQVDDVTHVCSHSWPIQGSDELFTLQDYAENLHNLLNVTENSGPYIMVGPWLGGYSVRVYADHYPDEVVGMVLDDSYHPDFFSHLKELLMSEMTPEEADEEIQFIITLWESFGLDVNTSIEQAAASGPFGDLLLMIIVPENAGSGLPGSFSPELESRWHTMFEEELQADLAALSTNSTIVVIEGVGHGSMGVHPDVGEAILQMVNDVRAMSE